MLLSRLQDAVDEHRWLDDFIERREVLLPSLCKEGGDVGLVEGAIVFVCQQRRRHPLQDVALELLLQANALCRSIYLAAGRRRQSSRA
jgi:hypothetical protein